MKSTEERIEQLEKEIQRFKAEYCKVPEPQSNKETEFSCDNKDCAQSNKLSVGDWVIYENGSVLRLYEKNHGHGVWGGEWCTGTTINGIFKPLRKATPEEVEKALRKEWARRCKGAGWDNPDEAELETNARGEIDWVEDNTGDWGLYYNESSDWMSNLNGIIYEKGKWAKPKPKKAETFFDWEFNNRIQTIDIGCERYSKEFLRNVYEALANLPDDATVKEIMKELRKLDL